MSLREALRRSVNAPEKVLHDLSPKEMQHATTMHETATALATLNATTSLQVSNDAGFNATGRATNTQQTSKNNATSSQQETRRIATPEEAEELTKLLKAVLFDWEPADRVEALQIALGDVEDALICWRDLWHRMQAPRL